MGAKDKKKKGNESKQAKKAEKQAKQASKGEKKAKSKQAKVEGSDAEDVDLDEVLEEYRRAQEQFLKVTETVCEAPPRPRAASTILASPTDTNNLLLFGGEYFNGSLAHFFNDLHIYNIARDEWRCGTFHHYADFWRLEPATREWTKIEVKGKDKSPPARSGHRMTYWKHYIILFGGFQDTSNQTKYLADLWVFDTINYVWHSPALPPAQLKPDARSSFTLLPSDQGAVLFGGYSRVKATVALKKKAGKGNQGASGTGQKNVLIPKVHEDCFFLRMSLPAADAGPNTPPAVRWEKRKKPANTPSPSRAGATMTYHKGRGIMFGGVHDVEASEEGMDSEFFNQLFAWNIERNRFMPLALRKPRNNQKARPAEQRVNRRGRGQANEEELLRQLAALETGASLEDTDGIELEKKEEEAEEEQIAVKEMPVTMEPPHMRFNAQLTVQNDVLYIYGGTYEKADREFTFDDLYAIDLVKLDGCKEVFTRPVEDWVTTAPSEMTEEDDAETSATSVDDGLPHPRPFESRREFFVRTSAEWQEVLMTNLRWKNIQPETMAVKEIKAKAFELSEEKWWDCREEITALEEEQEAAGIQEVPNEQLSRHLAPPTPNLYRFASLAKPNHLCRPLSQRQRSPKSESPPGCFVQRSGCCTTPSGDHAAFLPFIQSTASAALPTSHKGDLAMGGYCLPSRSTRGSHPQRSASGMASMTMGTWEPQPHQVDFSEKWRLRQYATLSVSLWFSCVRGA
ncbi:hypothetical protein LLEC1_05937 [Akanthomyces lecanii]|uniref:DUF4110 domain-containing protein n=1 Tax=Cordyceps confragosa TaxID=2714763 RepID=A0A179IAU9_CORDF|nr:hypothetical protein LLEC1_05937 [Akanthomyces lecanii]